MNLGVCETEDRRSKGVQGNDFPEIIFPAGSLQGEKLDLRYGF